MFYDNARVFYGLQLDPCCSCIFFFLLHYEEGLGYCRVCDSEWMGGVGGWGEAQGGHRPNTSTDRLPPVILNLDGQLTHRADTDGDPGTF